MKQYTKDFLEKEVYGLRLLDLGVITTKEYMNKYRENLKNLIKRAEGLRI